MPALLLLAAGLVLAACTPIGYCASAQALAIGLDVGGSWTPQRHYEDANAICREGGVIE